MGRASRRGLGDRRASRDRKRAAREPRARLATDATWVDATNVERAFELTRGLGADVIGAGCSGDPAELAPVLREHGVRLAIEDHPERAPGEVLAKIDAGAGCRAMRGELEGWLR